MLSALLLTSFPVWIIGTSSDGILSGLLITESVTVLPVSLVDHEVDPSFFRFPSPAGTIVIECQCRAVSVAGQGILQPEILQAGGPLSLDLVRKIRTGFISAVVVRPCRAGEQERNATTSRRRTG